MRLETWLIDVYKGGYAGLPNSDIFGATSTMLEMGLPRLISIGRAAHAELGPAAV